MKEEIVVLAMQMVDKGKKKRTAIVGHCPSCYGHSNRRGRIKRSSFELLYLHPKLLYSPARQHAEDGCSRSATPMETPIVPFP